MARVGIGFGLLLQASGALTRGHETDRLRLPQSDGRSVRGHRDELELFRWRGVWRRGRSATGGEHGLERASSRSVA